MLKKQTTEIRAADIAWSHFMIISENFQKTITFLQATTT